MKNQGENNRSENAFSITATDLIMDCILLPAPTSVLGVTLHTLAYFIMAADNSPCER